MESRFQFSNPALLDIKFNINDNFKSSEEIKINIKIETKTEREDNKPEAFVRLCIHIGEKSDKSPFYIYAEEAAKFKWDQNAYNEDSIKKLLDQNAPALLLSYVRPIIANVTGASPFSAYNIPFMNFTEK